MVGEGFCVYGSNTLSNTFVDVYIEVLMTTVRVCFHVWLHYWCECVYFEPHCLPQTRHTTIDIVIPYAHTHTWLLPILLHLISLKTQTHIRKTTKEEEETLWKIHRSPFSFNCLTHVLFELFFERNRSLSFNICSNEQFEFGCFSLCVFSVSSLD